MSKIVAKKNELIHAAGLEGCRAVIKNLLASNNMTVTELARRIHLPQPTIHRVLMGKTDDPKLSTLSSVADYFAITMDQLLGHAPLPSKLGKVPLTSHPVPILSWQEAIQFEKMIPTLSAINWNNWLLVDMEVSPLSFGLTSKKSMDPKFPMGSILVVDPGMSPDDGDLVIVNYPNTAEATIRELLQDGPNRALISIMDGSISNEFAKEIELIGVVIQMRFSYK